MENVETENKPQRPPREDLTPDLLARIPKINPAYKLPKDLVMNVGADLAEKRPVLLTGHQGTGKSSLFMQLAARYSSPMVRSNLNNQTTIADFVGYMSVQNGSMSWIDGVLPYAMRHGCWLLLDEIDFADAGLLSIINAVTEKDGFLTLKEHGTEIVHPHKDFKIMATANTVGVMEDFRHLYQGSTPMNRALISRFRVYEVKYPSAAEEVEILVSTVPECSRKSAAALVQLANHIRTAFNNETLDNTFSMRDLIDFVEMLTRLQKRQKLLPADEKLSPSELLAKTAEYSIYPKIPRRDAKVIEALVSKVFDPNMVAEA